MSAMSTELARRGEWVTAPAVRSPKAVRSGLRGRDWIGLVIDNLLRMKGRVVTTALGVIVGTAAVVVLMSLGAGLQRQALDSLGTGVTELRISGATRQGGSRAASSGSTTRRQPPSPDPVIVDSVGLARIEAVPGVAWVVPFEPVMGALDVQAGRMCRPSVKVLGLDPERAAVLGLEVAWGRFALERGQVVLGAQVAQSLIDSAGQHEAATSPWGLLGQTLNLYARRFDAAGQVVEKRFRIEVVGILAPRGVTYDFAAFMSEREALDLNGWLLGQRRDPARQGYTEVLVKVIDVQDAATVERQLTAMGLNVTSALQQAEALEAYFAELQALLGGIAAISLLVAAFSIANTMLMAVCERTREIGLMKAIGASNRDVLLVFLGEAGSIGFLGGVSGVTLGMGINGLINLMGEGSTLLRQMFGGGTRLQTFTPLWLPFLAVGFAVVVGIISGVVPARRAAGLRPIAALKSR